MPDKHADPEQPPLAVGLLTWALPPEKSGLSRAALEIAHAVAAQGADVRVFTLDRTTRTRDGGVEIIGCGIDAGGWLGATVPTQRGPVGTVVAGVLTFVRLLPQDSDDHLLAGRGPAR